MTIEEIEIDGKTVTFSYNVNGMKFYDVSSEAERVYNFGSKGFVKIQQPLRLHISESGHRIFDAFGKSHFIPMGWVQVTWTVREGQPNFVK